eukprot:13694880-Alexandrium_andersonii.AAC.1
MCIRDSGWSAPPGGSAQQASDPLPGPWVRASWGPGWTDSTNGQGRPQECSAVSYTHLTLPTICSVEIS